MQLSKDKKIFYGEDRDRTGDLLVANQALSQLSYFPFICRVSSKNMGVPGIEPGTLPLSGVRSNQLSYTPYIRACQSFLNRPTDLFKFCILKTK